MISLLGVHINKLVTIITDAGYNYTGILKDIKPEITDNYITRSTWDSSSQKIDGSKILSFYCVEDKPEPETIKLIGNFFESKRK